MRSPPSASRRGCSSPASIRDSSWAIIGLQGFAATPLDCPGQPDPMLHADLVRAALRALAADGPARLAGRPGRYVERAGRSACGARAWESRWPMSRPACGPHDPTCRGPRRKIASRSTGFADLLFAPTAANAANLRRDQVRGANPRHRQQRDRRAGRAGRAVARRSRARRWWPRRHFSLLVTCHRRENWGAGLDGLANALLALGRAAASAAMSLLPPNPKITERHDRPARRDARHPPDPAAVACRDHRGDASTPTWSSAIPAECRRKRRRWASRC